jgi:hypothetical protein
MRKVNELIIRGEPAEVAKLVERIEAAPDNGWKRNREIEQRLWRPANASPSTYCFTTPEDLGQPPARLMLDKRASSGLYVSSIQPIDGKILSEDQYNAILDRFEEGFLKPVMGNIDVDARIHPFRVKLEKIVSRDAFERLKEFSESANKITLNRDDRKRWSRFVTQVHRNNSALDSEELNWWLEKSGWPEPQRHQLVEWYEEGLSMLKEYDEERVE